MFKSTHFTMAVVGLFLVFLNFSCTPKSVSPDISLSLTNIYKDAAIFVMANFQLRLAEKVNGEYFYVSPDGSVQTSAREAGYFRSRGSGAVFLKNNQYRIVTAGHVVESTPSIFVGEYPAVFDVVQQFFIQSKILRESATREEVLSLSDLYFELERAEGFLVPSGTSEVSVQDDLKDRPNKVPKGCYAFERKKLGTVHDFAVLAAKDPVLFKPKVSFSLNNLADKEELILTLDSNPPKDIYCASFPLTERLSFKPETSKGIVNRYDGESLGVTLNYITNGSSGAVVVHANKVLGLVWRFEATTEQKQVTVPAPIFEVALRESFD